MAIFEIYDYRGKAEVAGVLRTVRYRHDDGLTIEGLSLAEANELLSGLATNKLSGIQPGGEAMREAVRTITSAPGGKPSTPETKDMTDGSDKSATQPPKKKRGRPTKAEAAAKKAAAEAAAKAAAEDQSDDDLDAEVDAEDAAEAAAIQAEGNEGDPGAAAAPETADDAEGDAEPEPEAEAASGAAEGKGSNGAADALIADLRGAKKLREAVGILADGGLGTADAIVAKVVELQDTLPLFKAAARGGNIEKRVRRAAASMGIE